VDRAVVVYEVVVVFLIQVIYLCPTVSLEVVVDL